MRSFTRTFPVIVFSFFLSGCQFVEDFATRVAKDSYYDLEAYRFDARKVALAQRNLFWARLLSSDNHWVLLADSQAELVTGYRYGDRLRANAYEEAYLARARAHALTARERWPEDSMVMAHWARFQIIQGDLSEAWETLNQAHTLDRENFYPWYYLSVVNLRMRYPEMAQQLLGRAEQHSSMHHQRVMVAHRMAHVARALEDLAAEEAAYLRVIELDPDAPQAYGNYANFLRNQGRYAEALEYYERAIAIRPYPLAVRGLERVRRKAADSADGERR